MDIENGWQFYCADFSVRANGKSTASGTVTLVRDPIERARWHNLPESVDEDDDGPPLYVRGHGMTIEEASHAANLAAANAKPISMNAAADAYEAEYNADQEARRACGPHGSMVCSACKPAIVGSNAGLGGDAAYELERRGYELKHTRCVGFWVDGNCGYMVSGGYFDTAQRACETAWERVQEAEASGAEPAWKFSTHNDRAEPPP